MAYANSIFQYDFAFPEADQMQVDDEYWFEATDGRTPYEEKYDLWGQGEVVCFGPRWMRSQHDIVFKHLFYNIPDHLLDEYMDQLRQYLFSTNRQVWAAQGGQKIPQKLGAGARDTP
jgi:hypothetical protein